MLVEQAAKVSPAIATLPRQFLDRKLLKLLETNPCEHVGEPGRRRVGGFATAVAVQARKFSAKNGRYEFDCMPMINCGCLFLGARGGGSGLLRKLAPRMIEPYSTGKSRRLIERRLVVMVEQTVELIGKEPKAPSRSLA